MRKSARRAVATASVLALITLSVSCWMPSFDPALSLSMEMDAFFADNGVPEWRNTYSISTKVESDSSRNRFLPFRMPWSPGGYVVTLEDGYLRIAKIELVSTGWETPSVWGDGNPLGEAALVGPMPGSTETVFVYRDPGKGLESVVINGGSVNPLLGSALTEGRRLLALGTWTDPTSAPRGETRFVEILVGETGDANARRGIIASGSFAIDISPDEPIDPFSVTSTGPGYATFDMATSTYFASLNSPEPSLWSARAPGVAAASKIVGMEALMAGVAHDALDQPVLLASGTSYTDFYTSSGTYLGWLPTGSWRFAFEYWDSTALRWISVFTRFAFLTDNHDDPDGNLAFAQVEGVPTAALLAEAAKNK